MIMGDRISERLSAIGLSQSEVGRRVGVSQATIAGLVSGRSAGSKHIAAIARELRTTPAYLTGDTDDATLGALPAPTADMVAEHLNSILVPYFDDPYALGSGTFRDIQGHSEMVPFAKEWLRARIHGGFDQLLLLPGKGDSMQPTINDGDVLLIDKAQIEVRDQDQIWAFDYGDVGMVKRLRRLPRNTGYLVQSDNQVAARDFTAPKTDINIVGRVISVMQWK